MLLYQNQSNTIELSRNFHTITIHPVKFLKFSTFFEFPTTKKGVVLSPKRSFLHHNRHQKSIQGVQKHNFWYSSCHDYDKIIFSKFSHAQKGRGPGGQMPSIQGTTASRICLLYLKLPKTVEKFSRERCAHGLAFSYWSKMGCMIA